MFINQPSQNRYHKANQLLTPHIPKIEEGLGGRLVLVSLEAGEVSRLLDQKAGIDAYLVQNHHIKSIALRVRKTKARTFTIRSYSYPPQPLPSELQKTSLLIASNCTYPNLTLSLSLDEDGGLLYGGCVYTKDLFKYILQNQKKVMNREMANGDGSRFVWIKWSELVRAGVKMRIF